MTMDEYFDAENLGVKVRRLVARERELDRSVPRSWRGVCDELRGSCGT